MTRLTYLRQGIRHWSNKEGGRKAQRATTEAEVQRVNGKATMSGQFSWHHSSCQLCSSLCSPGLPSSLLENSFQYSPCLLRRASAILLLMMLLLFSWFTTQACVICGLDSSVKLLAGYPSAPEPALARQLPEPPGGTQKGSNLVCAIVTLLSGLSMCPQGSHLGYPTPVAFLNPTSKWFWGVSRDFILSHQISLLFSIPTIRTYFQKALYFQFNKLQNMPSHSLISHSTFCMLYRIPVATWTIKPAKQQGSNYVHVSLGPAPTFCSPQLRYNSCVV